jgi:hypothetical protein
MGDKHFLSFPKDKTLKGQCHEIFSSGFFHESVSLQPQSIPLRPTSNFFIKFGEIFASQGAPLVSKTPAANLPPVSMTTESTRPESTTPAAKLPLV